MSTPVPDQIHSRRYFTLAVLCLSLLVVVVDGSIVNVAIPTLVRSLHASTASIQWVTDAYTLAMAGLLLSLGSLGDRIGRHRTLAGGLVVFGVGSALAGLAGSAGALITCRVIMGIGAARSSTRSSQLPRTAGEAPPRSAWRRSAPSCWPAG